MRVFYSSLHILSLVFVLSMAASSQKTATVVTETGAALDESTRLPVEGASVSFSGGRQLTATNEQGKFSIKLNLHDEDTLMFSAIGYETKKISYDDFLKSEKIIFLKNKIIEMNTVMVALNPGDHYKTIGKIDIRIRDINNSQEVLRLVPGLFIGQHAGGGKAEQIFFTGF
jgi:hypothetical protein